MPRRQTMVSAFNKWRRTQKWVTDEHAVHVMNALMLAEALDAEREAKGKVQAATASAYRLAFAELQRLGELAFIPPAGAGSSSTGPTTPRPEPEEDEDLFTPRDDL